jgi:D-alanyl-D-alanine endopeptidase (penicillin-binding protein 7)
LAVALLALLPGAQAATKSDRKQREVKVQKAAHKATASGRSVAKARGARPSRSAASRRAPARAAVPSFGHVAGLQGTDDPLDLRSSVALVVDEDTDQVLLSKNPDAVLPIASITKLMTALVVVESGLSLDEPLRINEDDADLRSGARSRLAVGTVLSRHELLHLALMSSENRAAHALGRQYPGGLPAFVAAMNRKAAELGMHDTRFVEPTGLSSDNRSSAVDLSVLVKAASAHEVIRELSTAPEAQMAVGARQVQFHNTNGLVRNPTWDITLQKTGYISAAGRCLVMQAELAGRRLIMVLLDSAGKYSRIGDAERIRAWLTRNVATVSEAPQAATLR